ncbi:MAG: GHKL domain-containing protein [Clostridia bacterium]|nr:GHKL domain-containing protein [Clostridia bacterium]
MENYLVLIIVTVISCVIYTVILFDFMDTGYTRVYDKRWIYSLAKISGCVMMALINFLQISVLNLLGWTVIFGLFAVLLYTDYSKIKIQRIFEIFCLDLLLGASETIGYLLIGFTMWLFGMHNIHPVLQQCLQVTFTKPFILIFYYLFITRLWKRNKNVPTHAQYLIYAVLVLYNLVNLAVIIFVVSNEMAVSFTERMLLMINMSCIVFADMLILYFTKYSEENGNLRIRLQLLEQQAKLQYKFYASQEDKYNESVKILHDANKHLKLIEEMYQNKQDDMAKGYVRQVKEILKPLALQSYTNNSILNILLNDKKKYSALHNIDFQIYIGAVDLSFMDSVEITTVFGNLLDNAIEACKKVSGMRFIHMKLDTYNEFTCIHIENSKSGDIEWNGKRPISEKGRNHGIGLLNVESVIQKYNGNIMLEECDDKFVCNIIFNS